MRIMGGLATKVVYLNLSLGSVTEVMVQESKAETSPASAREFAFIIVRAS
jgi:hypothetical protein